MRTPIYILLPSILHTRILPRNRIQQNALDSRNLLLENLVSSGTWKSTLSWETSENPCEKGSRVRSTIIQMLGAKVAFCTGRLLRACSCYLYLQKRILATHARLPPMFTPKLIPTAWRRDAGEADRERRGAVGRCRCTRW